MQCRDSPHLPPAHITAMAAHNIGKVILGAGAVAVFGLARVGCMGRHVVTFRRHPKDPEDGEYYRDYGALDRGFLWDTLPLHETGRRRPHAYERYIRPVEVHRYRPYRTMGYEGVVECTPHDWGFDGDIEREFFEK